MIKKQWPLRKKLTVFLFTLIGLCIIFVLILVMPVIYSMIPKVYTASNVIKLSERQKAHVNKRLGVEIPTSAQDIFFYEWSGRGLRIYCNFVLPSEEISKFAEKFVGIPLSQFRKYREADFSGIGIAISGPGGKWEKKYWNIGDIYERFIYFGTDKQFGWDNVMIVDPQTNRVYLCPNIGD